MTSGCPRRLARTHIKALVSAEPVSVSSLPDWLTTNIYGAKDNTAQSYLTLQNSLQYGKSGVTAKPNQTKEANQHNHLIHGKNKGVPPLSSGKKTSGISITQPAKANECFSSEASRASHQQPTYRLTYHRYNCNKRCYLVSQANSFSFVMLPLLLECTALSTWSWVTPYNSSWQSQDNILADEINED